MAIGNVAMGCNAQYSRKLKYWKSYVAYQIAPTPITLSEVTEAI